MANNEENTYQQPATEERSDKRGSNNIWLILLALLLLTSIGFNIYQYNTHIKKEKELNTELTSSQELQKQLEARRDSLIAQLEQYKGRNAKLDAELVKAENDIVKKAEEVGKLLKSNKINYNKYIAVKDQLEDMKYLRDQALKKVAELSEENKQLTNQNQNLKQEVTETKKTVEKQLDKLTSQQNKIDMATRLAADNISVTGVFYKKSGKEVETSKSKKIQKLKFCFTLAENKVADPGKRDVYIQVLDPHGQTVAIEGLGSGQTMVDATMSQYTTKEQIDYTKESTDYCLSWGKDSPFETGKYKIVISTEGYKLGEKEFTIR